MPTLYVMRTISPGIAGVQGVCQDGKYVYVYSSTTDLIYQLDTQGNITRSFSGGAGTMGDIAVHDRLFYQVNRTSGLVQVRDYEGTLVHSFTWTGSSAHGIEVLRKHLRIKDRQSLIVRTADLQLNQARAVNSAPFSSTPYIASDRKPYLFTSAGSLLYKNTYSGKSLYSLSLPLFFDQGISANRKHYYHVQGVVNTLYHMAIR